MAETLLTVNSIALRYFVVNHSDVLAPAVSANLLLQKFGNCRGCALSLRKVLPALQLQSPRCSLSTPGEIGTANAQRAVSQFHILIQAIWPEGSCQLKPHSLAAPAIEQHCINTTIPIITPSTGTLSSATSKTHPEPQTPPKCPEPVDPRAQAGHLPPAAPWPQPAWTSSQPAPRLQHQSWLHTDQSALTACGPGLQLQPRSLGAPS